MPMAWSRLLLPSTCAFAVLLFNYRRHKLSESRAFLNTSRLSIAAFASLFAWIAQRYLILSARAESKSVSFDIPTSLVDAIKRCEAIALLGSNFPRVPNLKETLHRILTDASQASVYPSEAITKLLTTLSDPKLPLTELEFLLGDVCEVVGRDVIAKKAWGRRRGRKAGVKERSEIAMGESARKSVERLAASPFSGIVTTGWCDILEEHFPHRVARNFGGFASMLAVPRIDKRPGRSRPVMQLWPGLCGSAHANSSIDELPHNRSDCELELAVDAPYVAFLRDLFQCKVALLVGWPELPPGGHLGSALRESWQKVCARDPTRLQPLAYAIVEASPDETLRQECMRDFGLFLIGLGTSADDALSSCLQEIACLTYSSREQ